MAALTGMKEIEKYIGFSESTVLSLIHESGMPARKARGIWLSDTESIDKWRRDFVEGKTSEDKKATSTKSTKKQPRAGRRYTEVVKTSEL